MKPTARFTLWQEIEGYSEATDREAFKAEVNVEGCAAFLDAHPEFPKMECTAERLCDFLSFGDKPLVRANLELAYAALDLPRLVAVEKPKPQALREIVLYPVQAAQTAEPTEAEAKMLEGLKDETYLSDFQRQTRDEKLRRAAIASRASHRRHSHVTLIG